MSNTAAFARLLEGLLDATVDGSARWEQTDLDDTYLLATPDGSVTLSVRRTSIGSTNDRVFGALFEIELADRTGQVIDTFSVRPSTRALKPDHPDWRTGELLVNLAKAVADQMADQEARGAQQVEAFTDNVLRHLGRKP